MGTNYYYHAAPPPLPCVTCGHCPPEPIYDSDDSDDVAPSVPRVRHIGKSSAGWVFMLRVYPGYGCGGPDDLDGWRLLFDAPGSYIESEYGDRIAVAEMLDRITKRSWGRPPTDPRRSGGVSGPNNLLRCIEDAYHKHGPGTWDLVSREFS